ncbi:expressed unknown protein [Seminavis robusta]|uniref:Uncharacterized protein n=1 Tax=Seminavis robusta TaxID=568900 RepID=A0A9N8EYM7_9STRA|nr:expressed unknown protein [Seminavis robusta]|eukprot:Sro2517_g330040.1 n/a (187) ;mRNA; f:12196-12756
MTSHLDASIVFEGYSFSQPPAASAPARKPKTMSGKSGRRTTKGEMDGSASSRRSNTSHRSSMQDHSTRSRRSSTIDSSMHDFSSNSDEGRPSGVVGGSYFDMEESFEQPGAPKRALGMKLSDRNAGDAVFRTDRPTWTQIFTKGGASSNRHHQHDHDEKRRSSRSSGGKSKSKRKSKPKVASEAPN